MVTSAKELQYVTNVGFCADFGGRGFSLPTSMAIRSDGTIFVASRGKPSTAGSNGIQIVTADHDFIGQIGTYNSALGGMMWPTSIVLDEDENLYLADEFYHRITKFDRDGNAIYVHDSNLDQIWTANKGTEFAVDFVCEAFDFLKNHVRKIANVGAIDTNSLYNPLGFRARKAWRAGDLEHKYYNYLNDLYTDFVQNYLEVGRRFEKVTNFETFLISFSKYMASIAYYFPLTKTGYILSNHC